MEYSYEKYMDLINKYQKILDNNPKCNRWEEGYYSLMCELIPNYINKGFDDKYIIHELLNLDEVTICEIVQNIISIYRKLNDINFDEELMLVDIVDNLNLWTTDFLAKIIMIMKHNKYNWGNIGIINTEIVYILNNYFNHLNED